MKHILALLVSLFIAVPAMADFNLQNMTEEDLEEVVQDFGAVFLHTTVTPAGSLGKVFGFQVGIVGSSTSTPGVEDVAAAAGESIDAVPSGAIIGQFSVPLGFTIEGSFIPSLDLEDAELSNTGFGVRWTMTDTVLSLPIDLALRVAFNQSELSFTQSVSSVDVLTTYEASSTAISLIASKSLVVVTPYVGVGTVSTDGELSVEGSNPIFNFTSATTASKEASGTYFFGGAEVNLLVLQLGIEAMKVYDSTRFSAKLAFGF